MQRTTPHETRILELSGGVSEYATNYFSENPEREALDTHVALGFGIRSKYP
ncbi:hypothetical protein KSC_012730 [Ktedonobacter sp. SOSP1-52]|nr:hypothetical protein KSC_012730 [Ktedonobacter sp. SOSP1-52]